MMDLGTGNKLIPEMEAFFTLASHSLSSSPFHHVFLLCIHIDINKCKMLLPQILYKQTLLVTNNNFCGYQGYF